MIARRIITVVLLLIVMLFLELNQHFTWGMFLTVHLTTTIFILFEAKLLPGIPQGSSVDGLYPPYRAHSCHHVPFHNQVDAINRKTCRETGAVAMKDGKVSGVMRADGATRTSRILLHP